MFYKTHQFLVACFFFSSFSVLADQFSYPFVVPDPKFNNVVESIEVPNMPPVRNQGGLGVCGAFTATTLAQHYLCQKNGWDCQKLSPEQQISDIGMSLAWYDSDEKTRIFSESVRWREAIISAEKAPLITNKCASYEQVVNLSSDPFENARIHRAMWGRIESAREKVNKQLFEDECGECARSTAIAAIAYEERIGTLKLKQSVELEKLRALTLETLDRAITQLLVPEECYTKDTLPQTIFPNIKYFPEKKVSYGESILQAREWFMMQKRPLVFDVFFPEECSPGDPVHKCRSWHQLVIAGYRKACAADGECVQMFKVHNSWGQKWQDMNNDGWLDIKHMYGVDANKKQMYHFAGFDL